MHMSFTYLPMLTLTTFITLSLFLSMVRASRVHLVNAPAPKYSKLIPRLDPKFSSLAEMREANGLVRRRRRLDFSRGKIDKDSGLLCVIKRKEKALTMIQKDPLTECVEQQVEQCHHTYVTQFRPHEEEVCEETFEKVCQITFKKRPFNETIRSCMRTVEQKCDSPVDPDTPDGGCSTLYESKCSTKHIEKKPGDFVADTKCQKEPKTVCADRGCSLHQGDEQCRDELVSSLLSVPMEECDLNPQRNCRRETRLVPALKAVEECHAQPKQVCRIRHQRPKQVFRPSFVKVCLKDGVKRIKSDKFRDSIVKNNIDEQKELESLEQHPLFQSDAIDFTAPSIKRENSDFDKSFHNVNFDNNNFDNTNFHNSNFDKNSDNTNFDNSNYDSKNFDNTNYDSKNFDNIKFHVPKVSTVPSLYEANVDFKQYNGGEPSLKYKRESVIVERNDEEGDVDLPKNFQSSFRFVPPQLFTFDRPEQAWHEELDKANDQVASEDIDNDIDDVLQPLKDNDADEAKEDLDNNTRELNTPTLSTIRSSKRQR